MYTPNLESARESKYLALKKKKRGKIKTIFIKGYQNLSKWSYDLTQIDFKLVKSVSEFRVPVENQQLSVSRDKIKDEARRCLLSTFLAPYRRVDSTRVYSSLSLCAHFENLKFSQVTV